MLKFQVSRDKPSSLQPMGVIKCQTCLRKFTLEAKPQVLEGCLHVACHFCLTKAVKYSEGKVTLLTLKVKNVTNVIYRKAYVWSRTV